MGGLDDKLKEAYSQLNTSEDQRSKMGSYLALVKSMDRSTYRHSIRVGLLGMAAGNLLGMDSKALFYAGVLHDIGKIIVPYSILKKKSIGKKDIETITAHAYDSYDILSRDFAFSAEVVVRHHSHQKDSYPKVLPRTIHKFSEKTRNKIEDLSKILAVLDFYDSAKNRKNKKFSKKSKMLQSNEVKSLLISEYPSMKKAIELFYETGLLI